MVSHGVKLEVLKKTSKYQKSTFALNVISKRESMGMTAEQFAEYADVPYPTLRDLEVGRTSPSPKTKRKIADALSCSIDELNTPAHLVIKSGPADLIASIVQDLGALDESELRAVRSLMDTALATRTTRGIKLS